MFIEQCAELERLIVGRQRELRTILGTLDAGKHVLLEGPPGTTKSTLLRAITQSCGLPFYMVEGNADLTPSKLLGYFDPSQVMRQGYGMENFEEGPLTRAMHGGILYIEEFNRMPSDTSNVLLGAVSEGEVHVPRYGKVTGSPAFRLICAQNPYDDIGTTRVSRALYDRLCRIRLDYQPEDEEGEIVRRKVGTCSPELIKLAVRLVRDTRSHPEIKQGASVRGALDCVQIAEELQESGLSWLEAVEEAALSALSGRIWLKETCERAPEDILKELLRRLLPAYQTTDMDPYTTDETTDESHAGTEGDAERGRTRPSPASPKSQVAEGEADVEDTVVDTDSGAESEADDWTLLEGLQDRLEERDPELREAAIRYASRVIVRLAERSVDSTSPRNGPLQALRDPSLASDELELDRTLERLGEDRLAPLSERLVVLARQPEDARYMIFVDHSYSMKGIKMLVAALTGAALALHVRQNFGLIAFDTTPTLIKPLSVDRPPLQVVEELLRLPAYGFTNLRSALELGLRELTGSKNRLGILITDGEWTFGGDPLERAAAYDHLHVIAIANGQGGSSVKVRAIADRGKGRSAFAQKLTDVPAAINGCLRG